MIRESLSIRTRPQTLFDTHKHVPSVTYFAKTAALASGYMATTTEICYMFLNDVLVGKKNHWAKKTGAPGEVYVDNEKNTNIFGVPDDKSTYPRYIIAFHKNPTYDR